jgi:PAS domain S-box-containing protein
MQSDMEQLSTDELTQFRESFATFNKIISNLQRQYLTLEKDYDEQERKLEAINAELRHTMARGAGVTAFLNSILNAMTSGVLAVTPEGRISHINPAAEKILGVPTAQALGRRYDDVIEADFGERYSATETIRSGIEFEGEEKCIRTAARRKMPLSVSTALLYNHDGAVAGAVEIIHDLTRTKKLEEEITRVRTLAALGEMAATVAHEVRNPLGGIGGFAALLKREMADDDPRLKHVERIIAGVDTLNQTVSALLDYTRRDELNIREIDLDSLIEDSVAYFQNDHFSQENGVSIAVEHGEQCVNLRCDPQLIRQVLLNLLRNSREAMPDGGRITIRCGKISRMPAPDSGENFASIEVSDTGKGIPKNIRDRIFRPFFTTKRKGNGLGLASAWKVMQAHGGNIEIKESENTGSTFILTLPLHS